MGRCYSLMFLLLTAFEAYSLKLQEVFIISRHNVRTPLNTNQKVSPHLFPKWGTEPGYLTEKGFLLEEYMGEYFYDWLKNEGLFTNICPDKDDVFIYSNIKQRTKETARAFAIGAFKKCNVTKHFLNGNSDPVFQPLIQNTSAVFKQLMMKTMQDKLDKLNLKEAYTELNRILEIDNSELCKTEYICDLTKTKDIILYKINEEPDIYGPLSIGNSVVDNFLMAYYDGQPLENIAWGKITTQEQWKKLVEITKANQEVRFNMACLSKDVAKHMLNYIKNLTLNIDLAPKLTMLVGHDSNINSVMAALGFKKYELIGQHELLPIGGKLVFQRWLRGDSEYLLKVEYVYQSREQLRNATKISIENPPYKTVMEIKECPIDENGFCPWNNFINLLVKL